MTYSNSFGRGARPTHAAPARRPAPASRYDRVAWQPPRKHAPSRRAARPLFARRRPPLARAALVAALTFTLAAGCWLATRALDSLVTDTRNAGSADPSAPQSTPRDAWRAGEVPALYQRDPAWAGQPYAEDDFGTTGCGPTCLSMVYVALTGRVDRDPAAMGALSESMGCATPDGTAWTFMTDGAAEVGLVATEVPADEASMRSALLSGSPVICSVGPGDFTTTGHFIVLTDIDEHGRLVVRDPNSPERTGKTWTFETVIAQSRALWSYSAA